jgi:hypothetical protein
MRRIALAWALTLVLPASASAAVTLSNFTVQPSTTQAGGHPDVVITQEMTYDQANDDAKDAFVRLAAGLGGNPQNAGFCSATQFRADGCPADSRVGSVTARAFIVLNLIGIDVNGDVYNLRPAGGEPARIGLILRPAVGSKVFLESPIELRPGADGLGLESTFRDQPRNAGHELLDTQIDRIQLTFSGRASKGSFMRNPTSCTPATTVGRVNSYNAPNTHSQRTSAFTPTGCDRLPFEPRVTGTVGAPGMTGRGDWVPLTSVVHLDPEHAALKRTELALPSSVGPPLEALRRACPAAQAAAGTCPASSRIGTATADSPLQAQPVRGPVYLYERPGGLPGLLIEVPPPVGLRLAGETTQTAAGLTNIIDNSPDLPLRSFALQIDATEDLGLLRASRDLCAANTDTRATGVLTAHSGKQVRFTTQFATPGCDPRASVRIRRRGRRAALAGTLTAAREGPPITGARLTLPRALRGSRRTLRASADGKRVAVSLRGRRAALRLPSGGVRSARITWSKLRIGRKVQRRLRRRAVRLTVPVVLTDSRGRNTSLKRVSRLPRRR